MIIRTMTLTAALWASGCVTHLLPYEAPNRDLDLPAPHPADEAARSENSLWSPGAQGNYLFPDARAFRVNDPLVVIVEERTRAERDTSTESGKDDSYETKLDEILGVIRKMEIGNTRFDGEAALALSHKAAFKGAGKTQRHDRVEATVPAMVKRVYPNGSIFIEGRRRVRVNGEDAHLYVSGIARPVDIDMDNRIRSDVIAEAQIEIIGRGSITRGSEKGWFSEFLTAIWPF